MYQNPCVLTLHIFHGQESTTRCTQYQESKCNRSRDGGHLYYARSGAISKVTILWRGELHCQRVVYDKGGILSAPMPDPARILICAASKACTQVEVSTATGIELWFPILFSLSVAQVALIEMAIAMRSLSNN